MRRSAIRFALAVVILGACAGGGDTTEGEAAITIQNLSFGDPISVSAGTTVTVTNQDSTAHTWTADDGTFDSGVLEPGTSFEFIFEEPGDFPFHCEIHGTMQGSLTVEG